MLKGIDAPHDFAIITNNVAGGMKDPLHDRRPIALTHDDALSWLDPATQVKTPLESFRQPGLSQYSFGIR